MQRLGRAQDVEPVAAAHLQVAQDDVEMALVQPLDRLIAVGSFFHFVAGRRQWACEPAPQRVVIVSDENATHLSSSSSSSGVYSCVDRGASADAAFAVNQSSAPETG